MSRFVLSKDQARQYFIVYHHLHPDYCLRNKEDILEFVRRVGCIQFDPLNVVGENANLVLQARVEDYRPALLAELLYQDRELIDFWDKNMAICLTENWPYYARFRGVYAGWLEENRETVQFVRRQIEEHGPQSSGDFELNHKVNWYYGDTRLARAALEGMYYCGDLIIHHKRGVRKFYDLAERHIPDAYRMAADPNRSNESYYEWFVLQRVGSVGMLWNKPSDAWLGVRGFRSGERNQAFQGLLEKGYLTEIEVDGIGQTLYMRTQDLPVLQIALERAAESKEVRILAPLDNMLWDRNLIRELFHFEYRWEVYKPAKERQYGYYVLPVLYGNRLVARLEAEHYKGKGPLVIKNWWWEQTIEPDDPMRAAVEAGLNRFTRYLGAASFDLPPSF
ncbi:winged helix-turn-helix domain-containing protein [Gorillibacterium massiliense]|uniref:winged helix-turn-helix domain-containing protein n=1 Tax=Gorillibacterium massiliense TaxID=1280390 RepID=UPI0004B2682E|nr:crosslink repair DNA glycosylase YcaQ family protein [Gorillibacterium massiliense]